MSGHRKYPKGYTKEQKEVYDALISAEWISKEDYTYIELVIDALTLYRRLSRDVRRGKIPMWYEMPNKAIVPHPAIKQMDEASRRVDTYMRQLGFSPAARAKMALDTKTAEDPFQIMWADHLSRRIAELPETREAKD